MYVKAICFVGGQCDSLMFNAIDLLLDIFQEEIDEITLKILPFESGI